MRMRSFGIVLMILALILGGIVIANPDIYIRTEEFAKTDANEELEGKIVMVPPWNASERPNPEGWVGFNAILEHADKQNYEAKGIIIPADGDTDPKMVMRAVNQTALQLLIMDSFSEATWNTTKIYAAAFLDGAYNQLYNEFRFFNLDSNSNYVILFRGLKNETDNRPIMISIKETYFHPAKLLDPHTPYIILGFSAATFASGLILATRKSVPQKRSPKRH